MGHVLNNSNNTAVGIQLESSGAAIDDAGDKISHSTRSEKDRLEQPALYVENSTFVVTSNKKKMKETSSDDATPSRPSKKLKEGNIADAVMSHAAGQSRMSPIQTSIQEVPCGFATPIMGGTGSNQTEQPVPGNQFITKTGSPSQGKKIVSKTFHLFNPSLKGFHPVLPSLIKKNKIGWVGSYYLCVWGSYSTSYPVINFRFCFGFLKIHLLSSLNECKVFLGRF